jgi:hypothetical protein
MARKIGHGASAIDMGLFRTDWSRARLVKGVGRGQDGEKQSKKKRGIVSARFWAGRCVVGLLTWLGECLTLRRDECRCALESLRLSMRMRAGEKERNEKVLVSDASFGAKQACSFGGHACRPCSLPPLRKWAARPCWTTSRCRGTHHVDKDVICALAPLL